MKRSLAILGFIAVSTAACAPPDPVGWTIDAVEAERNPAVLREIALTSDEPFVQVVPRLASMRELTSEETALLGADICHALAMGADPEDVVNVMHEFGANEADARTVTTLAQQRLCGT